MDDLDSQEFTKDIVPKGVDMIKARHGQDYQGSSSEKAIDKYHKVKINLKVHPIELHLSRI